MPVVESGSVAFRLLNNALRRRKIAQIYLFYGGDSETKKDTALAFLSAVIAGREDFPPEDDPLYRRVRSGSCADFYYLDGRKEMLKTETLQDLIRELQKTALETTGRKGYLIEDINNATDKVYNQVLKFMEETPGESTFGVLISDHIDSLLPTIVSRCERIPFPEIPKEELTEKYMRDGFDRSDAAILAEIAPVYRKRDLNDPAWLTARDLFAETLHSETVSLPVWLNREYFPRFGKEDRQALKDSLQLYASLVNRTMLGDTAFLGEEDRERIRSLSERERERYAECAQELLRYLGSPADLKLLMDHYVYSLCAKEEK